MKKIFAFLLALTLSLTSFAQTQDSSFGFDEWSTYENQVDGDVYHFFRRSVKVKGIDNDTDCVAIMGVMVDPKVGFRIIFQTAPSVGMLTLEYDDAHSGRKMQTPMLRYDLSDGNVSFAIEDMGALGLLLTQPMQTYTLRSDKGGLFQMTTEFNLISIEDLRNAMGS